MSMALQARVVSLETQVRELQTTVARLVTVVTEPEVKNPNGPRQMCPKCGEKPNYYLHVKYCRGKKAATAI